MTLRSLVALAFLLVVRPAAAQDGTAPEGASTDATASAAAEPVPHPLGPDRYWMTVSIGFSHWYGGTFGAPVGTFTPALTVGVVPVEWLELQLGYSLSVVQLRLPDTSTAHVGFLTLSLMLRRELRVAGERLTFAGGIVGGIVHSRTGVREAFGGAIAARYLIAVGPGLLLGPFVDFRALLYELAESPLPIFEIRSDGTLVSGHSDAHIQIGIALAF